MKRYNGIGCYILPFWYQGFVMWIAYLARLGELEGFRYEQ